MNRGKSTGGTSRRGGFRPAAASCLMTLALAAAGCTADDAADGQDGSGGAGNQTLKVSFQAFPESWMPGTEQEGAYLDVPYERLIIRDPDGSLKPQLATEWELTDEALTLELRPDVTFHDGTPFDADAVQANITAIRDGEGRYAGLVSSVQSIDVVDDLTVRLNLTQPTPSLPTSLTTLGMTMASPQAIADGTLNEQPVGTGPWAYDEEQSVSGRTLVFTSFPDYWDEIDTPFTTIELYAIADPVARVSALQTGELDIAGINLSAMEAAEQAGLGLFQYPAFFYGLELFARGDGDTLADVNVRQAICSAIDAEAIAKVYPSGSIQPRSQPFEEGQLGYSPDIPEDTYDPDEARRLLEEAGNPDLQFAMIVFDPIIPMGEVIKAHLEEVGIAVDLQVAPPPEYFSTWNSGRYPVGLGDATELTPYDWYQTWWAADAPNNPTHAESPELASAAEAAIAAGDSPEAEGLWADVIEQIHDEALMCGSTFVNQALAFREDRVQNVESLPIEPTIRYRELQPAD